METLNQGIYKITNLVNGKFYIGSSVNIKKRWVEHRCELKNNRHDCIKLQRSWNKYGPDVFEFKILELVVDNILLIAREQMWLDHTKAVELGFNICRVAGNTTGFKHTEESKRKMTIANIGNKKRLGKTHTEFTKTKMAESHKGNKARLGKTHSFDTKNKMSESKKGNQWNKGKHLSPETKQKISEAKKAYYERLKQEKNES